NSCGSTTRTTPGASPFTSTPLCRAVSEVFVCPIGPGGEPDRGKGFVLSCDMLLLSVGLIPANELSREAGVELHPVTGGPVVDERDRKSTRLNSSHVKSSYAVFCSKR